MSDFIVIVESQETPKAKKMRNEFDGLTQALDKVVEVLTRNPRGIVTIHREWDFGRKSAL